MATRIYVAFDVELDRSISNTGAGEDAIIQAMDIELDGTKIEAQSDRMPFLHYYEAWVVGVGTTYADLRESITARNRERRATAKAANNG